MEKEGQYEEVNVGWNFLNKGGNIDMIEEANSFTKSDMDKNFTSYTENDERMGRKWRKMVRNMQEAIRP